MAANPPDSKSLKTWEDAFQYPIPTVRQLEQQLRSELVNNQERLRTLVGYVSGGD
jgi:conserved oligomeric Golgi complex subunit 1